MVNPSTIDGHSRTDDVAAGGEAALEGLVHDHDALGPQPIAFVEVAAGDHGNAQGSKVGRRHERDGRRRLSGRMPPVQGDVGQPRRGSRERRA